MKPKQPLMSRRASGKLGSEVVFFTRRGQNIARKYLPVLLIPVEEEIEMRFHELWTPTHHPTLAATWEEWDLSALVPQGTRAVEVHIFTNAILAVIGARKPASTATRLQFLGFIGAALVWSLTTECSPDRKIEIYSTNPPLTNFNLAGYWQPA